VTLLQAPVYRSEGPIGPILVSGRGACWAQLPAHSFLVFWGELQCLQVNGPMCWTPNGRTFVLVDRPFEVRVMVWGAGHSQDGPVFQIGPPGWAPCC